MVPETCGPSRLADKTLKVLRNPGNALASLKNIADEKKPPAVRTHSVDNDSNLMDIVFLFR